LRRSNPGATACAAPAAQTVVPRPLDFSHDGRGLAYFFLGVALARDDRLSIDRSDPWPLAQNSLSEKQNSCYRSLSPFSASGKRPWTYIATPRSRRRLSTSRQGPTSRGARSPREKQGENFPACKALINQKMRKESRFPDLAATDGRSPPLRRAGSTGARRTRGQVWIPACAGTTRAETTRSATASTGPLVAAARKWRRNGLKRLNPRPEMVVPRKPLSHNIWYAGARLTVR
jgi:hypothetical protein